MALPQQYMEKKFYTEDEYFECSQMAEERWEFTPVGPPRWDGRLLGVIRAMSGGTDVHAAIISNISRALGNALVPRGCSVYVSDMRVHTGDGVNTFLGVAVVCGPRAYHRGRSDAINPLLIVEVLSPATAEYVFGDKFTHYQTVPTLHDYTLVAQDAAHPPLPCRGPLGDPPRGGTGGGVTLPSVGVTLALTEIYTLIEFSEDPKPAENEE